MAASIGIARYLENFQRHGREWAYVDHRGYRSIRWTYGQIADLAFQFARELEARAIGKGDRILLWGENCAEWVAVFFGCALSGTIVVPMDDAAGCDFALRVYQQVQAKLVVCSREHSKSTGAFPVIVLEELPQVLARQSCVPYPRADVQPGDTLEIVFTSGTTAEPKGVVITHGNVLANVQPLEEQINEYLKYERFVHPVRFLNLLPLSHVFGQFLGIFLPQLMAGTVIFQDTLNPSEIIRTIKRERVSVLVAVPRILQSLKEKIQRDLEDAGKMDEFRLRFRNAEGKHFLRRWWIFRRIHRQFGFKFWAFICGGAALDRVTEEFWGRLGYAVIQGYGLTETTSLISVNHPFKLGKGSVGKVLAGREIKLDQNGEILVRGAGVASAYWSGRALTPVAGQEGWYHTGDVGEVDAQGNLYFKGRLKDVIVTPAGMNVYPEDLEAALRRQPEVKDCVVIGIQRDGNAEPGAVLILKDRSGDAEPVMRRANESLAEYQRMRAWAVWPEEDFPRTSTQKPKIGVIQQTLQAQAEPKAAPPAGPLVEMISRITGRAAKLRPDANLETELNLSSLERVELMSTLEDRYQVDLSETSFAAASTVGDLERMLRDGAASRVHYHYPRWALRWPVTWIRLLAHYLLLRPAVFLLGWPRIVGRENLHKKHGPVLVVCNHISDVDVGYVLTALPVRLRHHLAAAAGGEAMEVLRASPPSRSWFGRIFDRAQWILGAALLNIFPLPRQSGFRQSFAYAGECVDRGYSVLVFPEGRHTTTGKILQFQAGIGILADRLGIPVVPMRIDGLFEVKQSGRKFALPGRITVRVGAPLKFAADTKAEAIARQLQKRVEEL
ncbi:MAG TPA: AMP-binding protein [Terriglobales bacterium]|nr:AMP-binding protein [Terriglobales bacterium]